MSAAETALEYGLAFVHRVRSCEVGGLLKPHQRTITRAETTRNIAHDLAAFEDEGEEVINGLRDADFGDDLRGSRLI